MLRLLPSLLITNDELGIFPDKFEQALLRRRQASLIGANDRDVQVKPDSGFLGAQRRGLPPAIAQSSEAVVQWLQQPEMWSGKSVAELRERASSSTSPRKARATGRLSIVPSSTF